MDINKRIETIKEYFLKFNVDDNTITLILKFPPKWTVPDSNFLREQYSVVAGPMQYGIVFATELENGFDKIFDAVDYMIAFNKEAQERMALFNEKAQELKSLFTTESLENLKSLAFTFVKKNKKTTKVKPIQEETVKKEEPIEVPKDAKMQEEKIESEDDSLLAVAQELISTKKEER